MTANAEMMTRDCRYVINWTTSHDLLKIMELCRTQESAPDPHIIEEIFVSARAVAAVETTTGAVVGFQFYDSWDDCYYSQSLFVHPDFRRVGIGTSFMDRLKRMIKIGGPPKRFIGASVSEHNLHSQLFLQKCGFICVASLNLDGTDVLQMECYP